ncbi:hypothetical protein P3S68_028414 [Capsicum galapagoense]
MHFRERRSLLLTIFDLFALEILLFLFYVPAVTVSVIVMEYCEDGSVADLMNVTDEALEVSLDPTSRKIVLLVKQPWH